MQAGDEVKRAVTAWEPRVTVEDVLFELDENTIHLSITWQANGSPTAARTTTISFET